MAAISVRDLRRTYTSTVGLLRTRKVSREALRGVSFEVERGELFGLLGPNGAGKTTLVKVLATVLVPTSGSAAVLGHDVVTATPEVRKRIGLVFGGERGLYGSISGRDVLEFWAALYRLPSGTARQRAAELLELVGLTERANDKVWTYSRGMKQRLHLARGLIANPEVLLLDEPTIGLDPVAAREMRQIIRQLKERGTTIFLTTHYMAEAEALCDRVAFINDGLISLVERPRVLTRLVSELRHIDAELVSTTGHDLAERLRGLGGVQDVVSTAGADGVVSLAIKTDESGYGPALALLAAAQPISVTTREPTLEDVYLRLLGERGMRV